MTTSFNTGTPPEPGLYSVKFKDYDDTIYSVWNGDTWYGLAYSTVQAEQSAIAGDASSYGRKSSLPWKELDHD